MNKKVRFVLFVKRNDISALNFELVYVVFSHLLLNLICFLEKYLYLFLLFACVFIYLAICPRFLLSLKKSM